MGCWQVKGKGWRYRFEFKGQDYTGQWFKTKAEARAVREQHRARLKSPPMSEDEPRGWDFASLMVDYMEEAQRKFRPKTWNYNRLLYQSFLDHIGNLPYLRLPIIWWENIFSRALAITTTISTAKTSMQ